MTMSCVAEENPSATAAKAIAVSAAAPAPGSIEAIHRIEPATASWESSIQPRRRPSAALRRGSGSRSTSGAQTNLNE